MENYFGILILISQIHSYISLISPLIFLILRLFKIYKYELKQNDNIKYLHTQVHNDFCLKYSDDNKPNGWIIGFNKYYLIKYICYINESYKNEYDLTILITTKKQRDILLNKKTIIIINNHKSNGTKNINSKKEEVFKHKDITIYNRNNYYSHITYCEKYINIGNNIPTNCQKQIIIFQ